MSKPKQIKLRTQKDAITDYVYIIALLAENNLHFTAIHKPETKQLTITCVKDCDTAKVLYPAFFEVKQDERLRRYAECIINYE